MFTELYPLARHTPLTLIITPRGDKLCVIVVPKPGEDSPEADAQPHLHKPITAIGTPAELDAELPAAIARYAQSTNALRTALDLPTEAIDEAAAKARESSESDTRRKSTQAKSAAKKSAPRKPASKPRATAKPPRPPVKAKAPAKAKRKDFLPSPKITPVASTESASTPSSRSASGPIASRPDKHPTLAPLMPKMDKADKAQCLLDGVSYLALIGSAKPSRVAFIAFAQSGRRYEKMWTSFVTFMDEVRAARVNNDDDAALLAADTAQTAGSTITTAGSEWPFPPSRIDDEAEDQQSNAAGQDRAPASTPTLPPSVSAAAPDTAATGLGGTPEVQPPAPAAPPPPANPRRIVRTPSGLLLGTTTEALHPGDTYHHAQAGEWVVQECDINNVIVDRAAPAGDAATEAPAAFTNYDLIGDR